MQTSFFGAYRIDLGNINEAVGWLVGWLADTSNRHPIEMRATSRLFQLPCRITLFTREHCGLCVSARAVLSDVWDSRPFVYNEIDIVKPAAQQWKDLYDFDVPVVCTTLTVIHMLPMSYPLTTRQIHISKTGSPEEDPKLATQALKLMHRFDPEQVRAMMDKAEGTSTKS
jgi:hypothetical protein